MTKKKKETLGNSLDFNQLFRVKGKKGIHVVNSTVNKSGMINMREFLDFNKKVTVKANDLVCLGHLQVEKEDKTYIGLPEVFDNLEKSKFKKDISNNDMMAIMCPSYAPEAFKPYHARQILTWYSEIVKKLKEDES